MKKAWIHNGQDVASGGGWTARECGHGWVVVWVVAAAVNGWPGWVMAAVL